MDQAQFKKDFIRSELKIDAAFGKIHCFIEFGNVTYWFADDNQDADRNPIPNTHKLAIDIEKLKEFSYIVGEDTRFYYGISSSETSFIVKAKHVFGKHRVPTKPIRYIRHYLTSEEATINTRTAFSDKNGTFVKIPKCNFDVEIAVDAMRTIDKYETFCLFSSDADFVNLARFLKSKGKKFILVKGGYIDSSIREAADLIINAQDIKKYITYLKAKT